MNMSEKLLILRRLRNQQLLEAVNGELNIQNLDDLMRLVGELECAYLHSLDDTEQSQYCLLKHLSTAYVLSCEVDGDIELLMEIIRDATDGMVYACQSCEARL